MRFRLIFGYPKVTRVRFESFDLRKVIKPPVHPHAPYFRYLQRLRAGGRTNMFGAIPYLMRAFSLDRDAAFRVVCDWEDLQVERLHMAATASATSR
jgi:hypothetical protein